MLNSAITHRPRTLWSALRHGPVAIDGQHVSVGTVLYHHNENYYHWIIEQLLKLRAIEHYENQTGDEVTLIVDSDAPTFVFEFLDICGYDESDLLLWDGEPLRVERLILPSHPEPTPGTLSWLEDRVTTAVSCPRSDSDWLYISRQQAKRGRRIQNYSEIKELFEQYNIRPLSPEKLTLKEEICAVRNATGIIGPHGAGLTSIIFGDQLDVVEIFNRVIKAPYYTLSYLKGHNYQALSGEPVGDARRELNKNMIVDTQQLEQILQHTLDR